MPVAWSWMPWILLSIAEVAGTTSMKLSRGFAELLPSVGGVRVLSLLGGGRGARVQAA
jgi:multidrug transporter EmrE-like cation transporter